VASSADVRRGAKKKLLSHLVSLSFPKKYIGSEIIILLSPEGGHLELDCRVIEICLRVFVVVGSSSLTLSLSTLF